MFVTSVVKKTPEKEPQPQSKDSSAVEEESSASTELEEGECPNSLIESSGSGEDTEEETDSAKDASTSSKPPSKKLFGQVKRPAPRSPEDPEGLKKDKKKSKNDNNIGKESLRKSSKQGNSSKQ